MTVTMKWWLMNLSEADPILCGRCYSETTVLLDPPCQEKPELLKGEAIGMYHCPDCGAMLLACVPHPKVCQRCFDHPDELI